MADRKLSMEMIEAKIHQSFFGDVKVIHSDDNAEKLVLHLRIGKKSDEKEGEVRRYRFERG
jgi:hypothetical protein